MLLKSFYHFSIVRRDVVGTAKRRGVKVISYDAKSGVRELDRLNRAVEAAKLKVPIAEVYELADAAKVHRRFAEREILGKIVLRTHRS
jgi:NADPH:quinone reductase-like Zn-dependent oxidoreductase